MSDLPSLFVQASCWAWDFLDRCQSAGFSPREETLTESLIADLAATAGDQLIVHKTTSVEEAATGADLAMAIELQQGMWLSLLLQAKKLDYRTGTYRELAKASAFVQVAHLIAHSQRTDALPFYLLYNGDALGASGQPQEAGGCSLREVPRERSGPPWQGESPFGCTVIPAERVKTLLEAGKADLPEAMASHWAPWECLLCPVLGNKGTPFSLPWPPPPRGPRREQRLFDLPWLTIRPPQWANDMLEAREGANPEAVRNAPLVRYFIVLRANGG